ncbi:antibiotic biosynthesis monooxygenase [Alteromonadaceae bacterium BrNp21-10]|nr:antibiotic biosynthesis monooxygenase [Alteromonadaceae bacterium BrNp21-10]
MIRVVYRWRVSSHNFDEFNRVWKQTTDHIHESVAGAFGSLMLRSIDEKSEIVTIAKWDSLASWESFWGNENPIQMKKMHQIAKRMSVEVFEEVADRTG